MCWLIPQCQEPRAEARNPELPLVLSSGHSDPSTGAKLCCFPRSLAESWVRSRTVGTRTGTCIGCQHHRWGLDVLCHYTSPSAGCFLMEKHMCWRTEEGNPRVVTTETWHGSGAQEIEEVEIVRCWKLSAE